MAISSKNLTIIVFATLVTISTLSCYYIYEILSIGYNINQQVDPYEKNIDDDLLLTYFVNIMYCIIKDTRTTPKINTSNLFFISPSGKDVTNATDNAPRIPPIIMIFRHTGGIFSFVNLSTKINMG